MLDIHFHPEIEQELSEAYQWYELQSQGLGEDFLVELENAYSLIQTIWLCRTLNKKPENINGNYHHFA